MKGLSLKSFITGAVFASAIVVPIAAFASGTQTVEAVLGKIKLTINGSAISGETLLYNGTTYVPIRNIADAIGAEVSYDASSDTAELTTSSGSTYWANKVYIPVTDGVVNTDKLIISNVTSYDFNYEFLSNNNTIVKGTAYISDNSAVSNVSDTYSITFEIHGDEITVFETGSSQLFTGSSATFVHKTAMNTTTTSSTSTSSEGNRYVDFKAGNYSSGSSASAINLIITEVTSSTFKYQVIASNGSDILTQGTATITATGKAECKFSDDYVISFTNYKNNVVEVTESTQKLFSSGKIIFYTSD